jgi:hypothetical protein
MDYVFGTNWVSLAQQASDNVKIYRDNREEQLKTLQIKIIKEIKHKILAKSLDEGLLKLTINIDRDFKFGEMLGLEEKPFNLQQKEKERLRKVIIDFLTEQDFNFENNFNRIIIKWTDPEEQKTKSE